MRKRSAASTLVAALLAALHAGAPMMVAAQGSVTGIVFDSLRSSAPLAGSTVVINELARYATADSRGRFSFDSVAAGHYTMTFLHPSLDSLDISAEIFDVDIGAGGASNLRLATPSPSRLYLTLCHAVRPIETGVIMGRVLDVDTGAPLASATVTAKWTEYSLKTKVGVTPHVVRAVTDANAAGVYILCGIPTDAVVDVIAVSDGQGAGPLPVTFSPSHVTSLSLAVSRRDSAAHLTTRELADSARQELPISPEPGTGVVTGHVRSADKQPLIAASVRLVGSSNEVRVDSTGSFRLVGVPAGSRTIQARSVGAAPVLLTVELKSGATVSADLKVDRSAQVLAAASVVGRPTFESPISDHSGFIERAKTGVGRYVDEKQIARFTMTQATSMLGSLATLKLFKDQIWQRGGNSGSGMGGNGVASNLCRPTVFVDGFQADVGSIQELMNISQLSAIEIYTAHEAIPPLFDRSARTGCGSIVVWSKFIRGKP